MDRGIARIAFLLFVGVVGLLAFPIGGFPSWCPDAGTCPDYFYYSADAAMAASFGLAGVCASFVWKATDWLGPKRQTSSD